MPFTVRTITGTTDTPTSSDDEKWLVFSSASAKTLDLENDATQSWAAGTVMSGVNTGAGDLTINPDTSVNINGATDNIVVPQYSTFTLATGPGDDEWQCAVHPPAAHVFEGGYSVVTEGSVTTTDTLDLGPAHKKTMTGSTTFTFMTPLTDGFTFVLHLLGAFTPTFPASVDWDAGTAPTYVGTGNGSLFTFTTTDGGTTWLGALVGSAYA